MKKMFAILTRSLIKTNFLNVASRNFLGSIKPSKLYSQVSADCKMTKSALVVLAPGAEEMEFTIAVDVLRRCGIVVTVGGVNGIEPVKCSRDVMIVPDEDLNAVKGNTYDVIVLPGGLGGSKAMAESDLVGQILRKQESEGRMVAAICAAPTVLAAHDIGIGRSVTSYPSTKTSMLEKFKYIDDENVVQDGNFITSKGPATAFEFALKISEVLVGQEKVEEVSRGLLISKE